jgi:hypothetical protein
VERIRFILEGITVPNLERRTLKNLNPKGEFNLKTTI